MSTLIPPVHSCSVLCDERIKASLCSGSEAVRNWTSSKHAYTRMPQIAMVGVGVKTSSDIKWFGLDNNNSQLIMTPELGYCRHADKNPCISWVVPGKEDSQ